MVLKSRIYKPLLFMILVFMLSSLNVMQVKAFLRNHCAYAVCLKDFLSRRTHGSLSFSMIQNILHVPFFAVLAFLWTSFFMQKSNSPRQALMYSMALCIVLSAAGETWQYFLQWRDASVCDFFLNLAGCGIGIGSYVLHSKAKRLAGE